MLTQMTTAITYGKYAERTELLYPRLGFVYKGVDSTVIMTDILGRGRHHRTPIVEKEATI